MDSKVEMDILDALDEIRSLNARQSKMDPLEVLLAKQQEQEEEVMCFEGKHTLTQCRKSVLMTRMKNW